MKRLQLHSLIAACLASLSLLVVYWVISLIPVRTLGSVPALPNQRLAPEINLPETSVRTAADFADKLIAGPHAASDENLADFYNFVRQVSTGQSDTIRGVYVPGIFALPIIQQPEKNPIYVSNKHDRVTQFQSAARNGVTGLLAHNYLAGSLFHQLVPGHQVLMVYGDGAIQRYRVVSIHRYQKVKPSNLYSNLVDLSTGQEVPPAEVFRRFYRGEHHVTFQTCLERNGRLDWGFLFVVALPLGS